MKYIFIPLIAVSSFFTSCDNNSNNSNIQGNSDIKIYNLDENTPEIIEINEKETFILKMEANPSTGYNWYSNIDSVSEVLKIVSIESEKIPGTPDNIVGAPSTRIYKIEGVNKGNQDLILDYKRGWENEASPAKSYKIAVTVK